MLRAQKRPTSENGLRGGRKKSQAELSRAELTDCHRKSEEGARIRSGFTSFSWRASIYDIHTILGFLTPNHPFGPQNLYCLSANFGIPRPPPSPFCSFGYHIWKTPCRMVGRTVDRRLAAVQRTTVGDTLTKKPPQAARGRERKREEGRRTRRKNPSL